MNNIGIILLVFITTIVSYAYERPIGCTPFGVRLALGRNYFAPWENEMLSIRFNTRLECSRSYVIIEQGSWIKRIYCQNSRIGYSNYSSYSHKCSIQFFKKDSQYKYMAYGWTGQLTDTAIPFANNTIKSRLIGNDKQIKVLVIGDWGYLQQKVGVMDRLDDAFANLLKMDDQPDIAYFVGDYAYDLSTNYGVNYQNFVIMLSQISSVWPCIFNTGNHEHHTKDDFMLFTSSFQLYNLNSQKVTMLDLGSFTLVLIDPFSILYEKTGKTELLAKFKRNLDRASKNKPLVASTHYPLACSGNQDRCLTERLKWPQFFDTMIDYDTVLYLGAHYHTYERIYPYLKGGQFNLIQGPYNFTQNSKYLISIVEGVGGNDLGIVDHYQKIYNYTAALSYNSTGYGIMEISSKKLTYEHYKANQWQKSVDLLMINYEQMFKKVNLREN